MSEKPGEEAPFPLTDVDKWVLSQTDEEFKYHDWDELRQILGEFSLDLSPRRLVRDPVDLLTILVRHEQPLGSQAQTIRPPQIHGLDGKDQGRVRIHDKLPPAKPTAKDLGLSPFHSSLRDPLC